MADSNHTDVITSTPDGQKTTLATALELVDKGFSPVWLRGKGPFENDWQKKENKSAAQLQQSYMPGYNLSIRCGKRSCPKPGYGLIVVDVDVYDQQYAPELGTIPLFSMRCRRPCWTLRGKHLDTRLCRRLVVFSSGCCVRRAECDVFT